jgi:hypothetical protein
VRKLEAIQVSMLVAGMVIGTGNVNADEQDQPIATITVVGHVDTGPQFNFVFEAALPSPPTPTNTGTNPIVVQQAQAHAINCALAYGIGPQSGWSTYVVTDFAWWKGMFNTFTTHTSTPPAGGGWAPLYGSTTSWSGNPFNAGSTTIFLGSIGNDTGLLINTLAHEWQHQLGQTDETKAQAYGNSVQAAYKKDKGKKCGGL